MRNVCKSVSSRQTDLFRRFCWNDSARTPFPNTSRPPAAPFTQLFSQSLFPALFAAVLIFILPLTTSAVSGTPNSNKSAPTRFAAGTTYLRKNGIAVLPITCASALNPRRRC